MTLCGKIKGVSEKRLHVLLLGTAFYFAALPLAAQVTTDAGTIDPAETARFFEQPGYSPYAGRAYPMRPLRGEQHLHTSWSGDAIAGGTRVGPDEALRYGKGHEITSSTGQKVRLSRPYDWMVVTDHSDANGLRTTAAATTCTATSSIGATKPRRTRCGR